METLRTGDLVTYKNETKQMRVQVVDNEKGTATCTWVLQGEVQTDVLEIKTLKKVVMK